jgi:hypothetical protein
MVRVRLFVSRSNTVNLEKQPILRLVGNRL